MVCRHQLARPVTFLSGGRREAYEAASELATRAERLGWTQVYAEAMFTKAATGRLLDVQEDRIVTLERARGAAASLGDGVLAARCRAGRPDLTGLLRA